MPPEDETAKGINWAFTLLQAGRVDQAARYCQGLRPDQLVRVGSMLAEWVAAKPEAFVTPDLLAKRLAEIEDPAAADPDAYKTGGHHVYPVTKQEITACCHAAAAYVARRCGVSRWTDHWPKVLPPGQVAEIKARFAAAASGTVTDTFLEWLEERPC